MIKYYKHKEDNNYTRVKYMTLTHVSDEGCEIHLIYPGTEFNIPWNVEIAEDEWNEGTKGMFDHLLEPGTYYFTNYNEDNNQMVKITDTHAIYSDDKTIESVNEIPEIDPEWTPANEEDWNHRIGFNLKTFLEVF